MKKLFLYLSFAGFITLFMACHKNNYMTTIPASHFQYVKADTKITKKKPEEAQKEQPSGTTEIGIDDAKPLVLAANVKNLTSFTKRAHLSNTTASKAATGKLIKALSVSKEASVKKLTLQERMLKKMLTKRIKKMRSGTSGTKPKANKTNTVALLSGIAGLLGLVLLFSSAGAISILLGLGAIIMGFIGKAQIRRNDERGIGWAITGIVSGIVIFFILLLAVLFIASLLGL